MQGAEAHWLELELLGGWPTWGGNVGKMAQYSL